MCAEASPGISRLKEHLNRKIEKLSEDALSPNIESWIGEKRINRIKDVSL